MAEQQEFPSILRIRCKSGNRAGMWLWTMSVSKEGLPIQSPNWRGIFQNPKQFTFQPEFVSNESAAFRPITKNVAEGCLRVLAGIGIDAEILAAPARSSVTGS
ncbi:MAG: hypothetical protein WBX22_21235 [Silvibacterium sp.]|jgi:hypothetical protein